jgi:hypothetical protein
MEADTPVGASASQRMSTKVADRRFPLHLAVLAGCSTGAYALTLATVTTFQSGADGSLAREREPVASAIDSIASQHDDLERAISTAIQTYDEAAATYARLGASIADVEHGLDRLAGLTRKVSTSASTLPSRVTLPTVRSGPRRAAPPATHATTGASG